MQEMYPVHPDGTSSPKMTGLRAQMQRHAAQSMATSEDGTRLTVRQESRATVAMLAPAVHIMHQVSDKVCLVIYDLVSGVERNGMGDRRNRRRR